MTFNTPLIISKKRDGYTLDKEEITEIINGYTAGTIPDYQMSALLMAVFFNGLNEEELNIWTDAMLHSGNIMTHNNVEGIKVDKHSTGGVGDKISVCLAPAVAACGVPVPMISGRGLGHTGGTLDKLESIPGFNVNLSSKKASQMLKDFGLFLIGQTDDLAPADKKLYALRDVTGTVESIPLISSSIMSKKLAEGIDALVLDVKFGKGAFMKSFKQAKELALTLSRIGEGAGKKVHALLTDMNTPIGMTVGNALETAEAIDVLSGKGPKDTIELTKELGAHMLLLGGKCSNTDDGKKMIAEVLNNGKALDLFAQVIEAQGGNSKVCGDTAILPKATGKIEIKAPFDGFITDIDPVKTAFAALKVQAGRIKKEDNIDPSTGIQFTVSKGDKVDKGQPVALIHHNKKGEKEAESIMKTAIQLSPDPISIENSRIKERIISNSVQHE
ncbi:MAG: thymidine phosphorylase [Deltaproteobacteria bacterium]|nr:thymidine phosphorylase [Deltaproteobacteria bacterium]